MSTGPPCESCYLEFRVLLMRKKKTERKKNAGFHNPQFLKPWMMEFTDDLLAWLIDPFLNFNTELIAVEQENNDLNRIVKGRGACVCLSTRGMWTLQINTCTQAHLRPCIGDWQFSSISCPSCRVFQRECHQSSMITGIFRRCCSLPLPTFPPPLWLVSCFLPLISLLSHN